MPPPTLPPSFIMTWGFEFISYTVDIGFWGIAIVMVMQYFRKYAGRDSLGIRIVVGILGAVATNHAVFLAILNYKYFITLFGDFEGHDVILYEANVMLCSVYIVAFVSHMFYASRIWILTKHNWKYVLPVILLGLLQISAGIAQTVMVAKVHLFSKLQADTAPISSTQSGAALACDLVITAILCFILRSSRTGVDRTDSVLDKMVMYALNRGVMTSLWALLQLIFFVAMPQSFVFMLFIEPSCHLYVISVCSMLMSRESLRAELRGSDGVMTFPLTTYEGRRIHRNVGDVPDNGSIQITTSILKWVDETPGPSDGSADKRVLRNSMASAV